MTEFGTIARTVAARHPARVLGLTSVVSTTGSRRVGQPARSTLLRLAQAPARTVEESVERHPAVLGHTGSTALPPDEEPERARATAVRDRGGGPRAGARHVEVAGTGQHLAPGVVDRLVQLTTDHVQTTAGGTR